MNKKCVLCGENLIEEPLYVCEKMPAVSQNLPTDDDLCGDEAVDLNLCQCSKCGLIQFDCEPVEYYKDSTRAGERSEALIELIRSQYKHLIETYDLKGKKVLEIGAGKGGFLKTLKEMDEYAVREYGIENNAEFVRIARDDEGVNVICGDPENPDTTIPGAPFDAFVSFSYPARLVKPNDMLQMVNNNLVDGGIGLVMVPSFEHLIENAGFFDIVKDHIAYYSLDTLRFLFQKNGFDMLEAGETSKAYIYMVVRKRKAIDMASKWRYVEPLINEIQSFVFSQKKANKKIAVWCAGHFAFTVLSVADVGKDIEYIIDNAKFKQDHYAPGSHVVIKGPEYFKSNPVDTIIILGPIYIDEIVNEIKEKCSRDIDIYAMDKEEIKEVQ